MLGFCWKESEPQSSTKNYQKGKSIENSKAQR